MFIKSSDKAGTVIRLYNMHISVPRKNSDRFSHLCLLNAVVLLNVIMYNVI